MRKEPNAAPSKNKNIRAGGKLNTDFKSAAKPILIVMLVCLMNFLCKPV